MKKTAVLLLALLFCFRLSARKSTDYHGFTPQQKQIIYLNDFNNDRDTNWVGGKTTALIEKGYYLYWIKKGEYLANGIEIPFDETRDFEIEFRAKVPEKQKGMPVGIFFWGRGCGDSAYYSRYWYFDRRRAGEIFDYQGYENKIVSYQLKIRINKDRFNKYTLRKIRDTCYVFVNEKLVSTFPFQPFYGYRFGLGAGNHFSAAVVMFDYLRICYLKID